MADVDDATSLDIGCSIDTDCTWIASANRINYVPPLLPGQLLNDQHCPNAVLG
jgi:hypothetical protein